MRALSVVMGLLLFTTIADARPKRRRAKRVAITAVETSRPDKSADDPVIDDKPKAKKSTTGKKSKGKKPGKAKPDKPRGQSIGAPWSGTLRAASRLRELEGTHIRRPQRTYGTRTTVEHTRRAILDTLEAFPKAHVFAIGDLSAKTGGWISEHHSHQSGRDVDLGLFYKRQPAGYPDNFVTADESTLDAAAMWTLISNLSSTRNDDGGVLMMFLDFEVQGIVYHWAQEHGVSDERLERVFQFPHGRGASAGLVRHEPNHDNHLHVRFKCGEADVACR